MNKQQLIKKIANRMQLTELGASQFLEDAEAEGWLRNPGEPIEPEDIREGDRVRVEYPDGDVHEYEATGREAGNGGAEFFLLDRPKPELPTEPGSMVWMRDHRWAFTLSGVWIATDGSVLDVDGAQEVADEDGFEVVA